MATVQIAGPESPIWSELYGGANCGDLVSSTVTVSVVSLMSIIKPRMAVAYHFFNDFDTSAVINDRIRTTYDGPLSLSVDYMVWNVTKNDIRVRMAAVDEDVWPPPATEEPQLPDPSLRIPYSDMIGGGKYDVKDVIQPIYGEINKEYGLNEKQD